MINWNGKIPEVIAYGTAADYCQLPSPEQACRGVIPLDSLPAAWWNKMWHDNNEALNCSRAFTNNVGQELCNIIVCRGGTINENCNSQLYSTIFAVGTADKVGMVKSSTTNGQVSIASSGVMTVNGYGNAALQTTAQTVTEAINELKDAIDNFQGVTYSDTAPLVDGTAAAGTSDTAARGDHVHPIGCCIKSEYTVIRSDQGINELCAVQNLLCAAEDEYGYNYLWAGHCLGYNIVQAVGACGYNAMKTIGAYGHNQLCATGCCGYNAIYVTGCWGRNDIFSAGERGSNNIVVLGEHGYNQLAANGSLGYNQLTAVGHNALCVSGSSGYNLLSATGCCGYNQLCASGCCGYNQLCACGCCGYNYLYACAYNMLCTTDANGYNAVCATGCCGHNVMIAAGECAYNYLCAANCNVLQAPQMEYLSNCVMHQLPSSSTCTFISQCYDTRLVTTYTPHTDAHENYAYCQLLGPATTGDADRLAYAQIDRGVLSAAMYAHCVTYCYVRQSATSEGGCYKVYQKGNNIANAYASGCYRGRIYLLSGVGLLHVCQGSTYQDTGCTVCCSCTASAFIENVFGIPVYLPEA